MGYAYGPMRGDRMEVMEHTGGSWWLLVSNSESRQLDTFVT